MKPRTSNSRWSSSVVHTWPNRASASSRPPTLALASFSSARRARRKSSVSSMWPMVWPPSVLALLASPFTGLSGAWPGEPEARAGGAGQGEDEGRDDSSTVGAALAAERTADDDQLSPPRDGG